MTAAQSVEYVDVLIVGAGLSGIGAACYLTRQCPQRSLLVLEARERLGGTWDLFRYPGIRSDSDMFTMGYAFKPWSENRTLASGDSIRRYIEQTAAEYGVDRRIRYRQQVTAADWDSQAARWTVTVATEGGAVQQLQCNFLYSCSGYYRYDQGFIPQFPGQQHFSGPLFHAQHWPEGLDYRGKRVVVIGSGATAVTLVPELARDAAHTIMLQRSPTYVVSLPAQDGTASALRRWLPNSWVYHITRWKRVLLQMVTFNFARRYPQRAKKLLLHLARKELGEDYDVARHFNPRYYPWDQRLCAVPDGDLFAAIRAGRAEVVTDRIDRFTTDGIALASGRELQADIIVLATGLNLLFMGGIALSVDGQPVQPSRHVVYRGMMLSGVPNFVQTMGYTNSSWTLKADLTAQYVCRLLRHMSRTGARSVVPELPAAPVDVEPLLDFSSGYIQRSISEFPQQGRRSPWRVYQNYFLDLLSLRFSSLTRTALRFR